MTHDKATAIVGLLFFIMIILIFLTYIATLAYDRLDSYLREIKDNGTE